MNWLLPVGGALAVAVLLLGSSGDNVSDDKRTTEQLAVMVRIRAEALKQGVPVELALATAEAESNFRNVKATNGASYGPLQVHKSHLLPGEAESVLLNMDVSIPRGITILRNLLARAGGDPIEMRVMYFCGPYYRTKGSCSDESIARTKSRWAPVAARWGVKAAYPV